MEPKINPQVWFGERFLSFTPVHFCIATTPLTSQSKLWIYNKLSGRFSIVNNTIDSDSLDSLSVFVGLVSGRPAFEDPKEATLYELTWS